MKHDVVAQVFAEEWPRVVATLVADLRDVELAEDCAQDAFETAARRWPSDGTPDRPGAWLLTTARRRAIDRARRDRRFTDRLPALHQRLTEPQPDAEALGDHQLALIFGCCHPSLAVERQIALTLREVCGLSTRQIAESFLVSEATMAKRLVRAQQKIRTAGIPFSVPDRDDLDDRLDAVLGVIYLVFNAGHTAPDAVTLVRGDLCDEARWLARLVTSLTDENPEALGLSALLCFTDSRRATRVDASGQLVLLEDQDRSRWNHDLIAEGQRLLGRALAARHVGSYQLQAMIAGCHATASSWQDTDWQAIAGLYRGLARIDPSPVVELNRAVAVSMADNEHEALELLDRLAADGQLDEYHYFHAARADVLRRLGRPDDARRAYERATELTTNDTEREFLRRRVDALDGG